MLVKLGYKIVKKDQRLLANGGHLSGSVNQGAISTPCKPKKRYGHVIVKDITF